MKYKFRVFFSILLVLSIIFSTAMAENISIRTKTILEILQFLSDTELEYIQSKVEDEINRRKSDNKSESKNAIKTTGTKKSTNDNTLTFDNWKGSYFLDKFKEPTNEKYISYLPSIGGSFSNSVVRSKKLSVKMIISLYSDGSPKIQFDLLEYGTSKIREGTYYCDIKNGDTVLNRVSANMYGRLYLTASEDEVFNMLMNDEPIKFYIYTTKSKSTYSFTIMNRDGLEDAFYWLSGNET